MEKIKLIDLKVGDKVFFIHKGNEKIRWFGKVDKINLMQKCPITITYYSLFGTKIKRKHTGNFNNNWNNEHLWDLFKITKSEYEKFNKQLIVLSLN